MTYAGISDNVKRASVIAYMNSMGTNLPLPAGPAPTAEAPAEAAAVPADAASNAAAPAENATAPAK